MDIYVLDENFDMVDIVDDFKSMIWTDRYNEIGDFELVVSDIKWLKVIKKDYYLQINQSDRLMIVDCINGSVNEDDASEITFTGHSLEHILTRRIVWYKFSYQGPIHKAVQTLMYDNAINPHIQARKIPNLGYSWDSSLNRNLLVSFDELHGDSLYETIKSCCDTYDVGFRIRYFNKSLSFELYLGIDRSYSQSDNLPVVFSEKLDNLQNAQFTDDNSEFKNVAYVFAENDKPLGIEGVLDSDFIEAIVGDISGLNRREIFVETSIDEEYMYDKDAFMKNQGRTALKENSYAPIYEGEAVWNTESYVFNKDYFLGDIVQYEDRFGNQSRARITEVIFSEDDSSGYMIYPTFSNL